MIDSAGNLWIVEYKGGSKYLTGSDLGYQMTNDWVKTRITKYAKEGGALGCFWAEKFVNAIRSGSLHGIAVTTAIEGTEVLPTKEIINKKYHHPTFKLSNDVIKKCKKLLRP